MTPGQRLGLAEIRSLDKWSKDTLVLRGSIDDSDDFLKVPISISTEGVRRYPGGMPVEEYEDLEIWIPPKFPLEPPYLLASDARFASYPHVTGCVLCLYIDEGSQWSPADGMFGFVHRMGEWFVAAAAGELDPDGGPIHPPVELGTGYSSTCLVIVGEIPESENPRLIWANMESKGNDRFDVTDFHRFEPRATPNLAAVVLANQSLTYDYASTYGGLAAQLEELGFTRDILAKHLIDVSCRNPKGTALVVLVGTLNRRVRGHRLHHLVGWELPAVLADQFRALGTSDTPIDDTDILDRANEWAATEPLPWTRMLEARASVTRRRDERCSMAAFAGKRIELWGCGALGGWIAEFIVRARPASLILRDKAAVGPGLLVRQPYDDRDVSRSKATALADRLRHIYGAEVDIRSCVRDVIKDEGITATLDEVDVLVDATASRGVSTVLDRFAGARASHPPIISVVTDSRCELTAMFAAPRTGAGPGYSAGAALRYLKADKAYERLVDAFWGSPDIDDLVQPEPGCSAPTFHGSAADVAGAASALVNQIGRYLDHPTNHLAVFSALPHGQPLPGGQPLRVETPIPTKIRANDDYTVLLTEGARVTIHAIASNALDASPPLETGGLLFGERDDAARAITIGSASGPPPDSVHSHTRFIRGMSGVDDLVDMLGHASDSERWTYLGDWHSHPGGIAELSSKDRRTAKELANDGASLLLIWAGTSEATEYTAKVLHPEIKPGQQSGHEPTTSRPAPAVTPRSRPRPTDRTSPKPCDAPMPPRRPLPDTRPARPALILRLSGRGFRATLASLGVLRFLADADLLDDVRIISSVSGGSLANAAMATEWTNARTQPAFDKLVLRPMFNAITSHSLLGELIRNSWRIMRPGSTRTTLLADQLDRWFLQGRLLKDLPAGCRFVFNAANVREEVRFRFDADRIGDHVNGTIPTASTRIRVAEAVAASAAVPGYFPPLKLGHLTFPCNDGSPVEVADGSDYESLGPEANQRESGEPTKSFLISLNTGSQLAERNWNSINRPLSTGPRWRANAVMHRQADVLSTRNRMQPSATSVEQPFVILHLSSAFPDQASSDQLERLTAWRSRNEEHTEEQRSVIASIPATFAKLDPADALALVQRGWWLAGATISVYRPNLFTKVPTWVNPLLHR